jgi:hypothetical protein
MEIKTYIHEKQQMTLLILLERHTNKNSFEKTTLQEVIPLVTLINLNNFNIIDWI